MNVAAPSTAPSARTQRIEALLIPVLERAGMVLEAITVTPAGKRRLVRVLVDRAVQVDEEDRTSILTPLSLDEVGDITRAVSDALDDSDAMGEAPYVLEVGSSGTDRPLTTAAHFRRNVGRLINLTVTDDDTRVIGRIAGAGEHDFDFAVPVAKSDQATTHTVPYDTVERARIELEFNPPREALTDIDTDIDSDIDIDTDSEEQD